MSPFVSTKFIFRPCSFPGNLFVVNTQNVFKDNLFFGIIVFLNMGLTRPLFIYFVLSSIQSI